MKLKTAIISGVTGQDGSYLARLLLDKGYFVVGLKRRTSIISTDRIDDLMNSKNFVLEYYSLFDPTVVYRLIQQYQPDEIYNLAAQSHVKVSFDTPIETMQGILMGTAYWLEAIRVMSPKTKFYQASSSEMFGTNPTLPLNEESTMLPASPYACAKLAAHHLVKNYRESYGLYACSGILMNHESPLRGETFVTRKVSIFAAKYKLGLARELRLGNLDASRDWGFAGDYCKAMWMMLNHTEAEEFVISTGNTKTVREWVEEVFKVADLDLKWSGTGLDEVGLINGTPVIKVDSSLFRPQEVPALLGDSSKAHRKLGWKPVVNFKELAKLMYTKDFGNMVEKEGGIVETMFFD